MKRYKLVIFDFDGTLFATHEAIIHCIHKTFETYKKPKPSDEAIYKTITKGMGLEQSFNLLDTAPEKSLDELHQWIEIYRDFYRRDGDAKTQPFGDVKGILQYVHSTGAIIIIVSNKGPNAINSALEKYDLMQYITLVVGDTKGIKKKPDPMIFDEILKPKFNDIDPNEILVIGDTSADLLFAKNIGADGCWAMYGYGIHEECDAINPVHRIRELQEITKLGMVIPK
ncbi:MAG: HAD family hydrolase [Gammaproteobacteria bacterium]